MRPTKSPEVAQVPPRRSSESSGLKKKHSPEAYKPVKRSKLSEDELKKKKQKEDEEKKKEE